MNYFHRVGHPHMLSFLLLQVLSANIVKCGSKTFAVYSLSVTDVNNHSWSIKRRSLDVTFCFYRYCEYQTPLYPEYISTVSSVLIVLFAACDRFRHFEELHRRLKEYHDYNLHLPPKHFLSTGLDVPVIRERCKFLNTYLKVVL